MEVTSPIQLRPMTPDDERFVASSWFESFWKTHCYKDGLHFKYYQPGMDARIKTLIKRAGVTVAYATVAPTEILGWICIEGDCLHYVYVKAVYRRQGIARALAGEGLTVYSHPSSRAGAKFLKALGLEYNPFRLE